MTVKTGLKFDFTVVSAGMRLFIAEAKLKKLETVFRSAKMDYE